MNRRKNKPVRNHGMQEPKQQGGVSPTALGHKELAKQLFRKGRYSLALEQLDLTLKINPEQASAYFIRGLIAIKLGKVADARKALRFAVDLRKDFGSAWLFLAILEQQSGNPGDALRAISRAIDNDRENARMHIVRGNILRSMEQWDDATRAYRAAVKLKPNAKVAHFMLGHTLQKLGRREEAEQQIVTALRLAPTDPESRLAYGDLLLHRGLTRQAIDEYKVAVELKPHRASVAYHRIGLAQYQAGELQAASLSLNTATRLDPRDYQSFVLLGRICRDLERLEEATIYFEAACAIDESYPEAIQLLEETTQMIHKTARS